MEKDNPLPIGEAPEPNSFEDFVSRFDSLLDEAEQYGIDALAVLCDDDRLNQTESKIAMWRCGPVKAIGMSVYAKRGIERYMDQNTQ